MFPTCVHFPTTAPQPTISVPSPFPKLFLLVSLMLSGAQRQRFPPGLIARMVIVQSAAEQSRPSTRGPHGQAWGEGRSQSQSLHIELQTPCKLQWFPKEHNLTQGLDSLLNETHCSIISQDHHHSWMKESSILSLNWKHLMVE